MKYFAGFSGDSKRFAYVTPFDAFGEAPFYVVQTAVGDVFGTRETPHGLEGKELPATNARLQKQGFATDRRPPPADLRLDAKLGASPPRITLRRGASNVEVPMGKRPPFGKDDVAEIWGVSPDQKVVAVHIGPRVRAGDSSPGLHFFQLSPMP